MALDEAALGLAMADALAAAHGQGKTAADTTLGNSMASAIVTCVKGGDVATVVTTVVVGTLPSGPVAASGSGSGSGSMT